MPKVLNIVGFLAIMLSASVIAGAIVIPGSVSPVAFIFGFQIGAFGVFCLISAQALQALQALESLTDILNVLRKLAGEESQKTAAEKLAAPMSSDRLRPRVYH